MSIKQKSFSEFKQLADAIVAMFGRSCEVAIHDLTDLRKSVVHISGDVTGRKIGAPATDLLVKALGKKDSEIKDMYNYKTTARDGRSIKSSTIFLRDTDDNVVAAFCINLDTTDFLMQPRHSRLFSTITTTMKMVMEGRYRRHLPARSGRPLMPSLNRPW